MKFGPFLGGTLLVAGTTIGVGMLGLPVMTGFMGFFPSLLLLSICWLFMLFTGFLFIEINAAIGGEANLISMAEKTLGFFGKAVAWVVYLLLLYSLMAAYISGSAPLFMQIFPDIPIQLAKFALPLLFGSFIYLGTKGVDWINRILMIGLVLAYILLIAFIPTHVNLDFLSHISWQPFAYAAPVVLTSFGYHIIIPSLATYLHHDKKTLYKVVILGSLIAFVINAIWQFLVLGSVPLDGVNGLKEAWIHSIPATTPLANIVSSPFVKIGAYAFSLFAIITSFLGVGLSLSDFLRDGLKIKKSLRGRAYAILLTFIPPLIFVFSYERGFLIALEYAGAFVAILLILLPAAMVWNLETKRFYQTTKGRVLLSITIAFAIAIVCINLAVRFGLYHV
ncbi:MAG: tyrosine transporter [Chlamydiae bacterium]|nr:tyrosine transporter [Chlamydiota bacterium]